MTLTCAHCGQPIPDPPDAVQTISAEWPDVPIAEMVKRGWLGGFAPDDPDSLRNSLVRFFDAESAADLRETLGSVSEGARLDV